MLQCLRNLVLILGLVLLAACQSDSARFEGKWRSVLLDGTTMVLTFEGKGKDQVLTMETTINALTERVKIPVEIIEDGVYAGEQAVGMKPGAEVVFLLGNGQLISELGTFKR